MTTLDNTVVNVALPSIQRDLHMTLSGLEWVTVSYVLTFGSLLLVAGRVVDLYGRRESLVAGLALFAGASLLAGLASTSTMLIGARALQGAGAALVIPATLAVVSADLSSSDRDLGVGVWTTALAVALALGPMIGGFLSQHWSWQWIFLLNVPVGGVTVACTRLAVGGRDEALPPGVIRRAIDVPGLLLSGGTLLAVTFALTASLDVGFGSPLVLGLLTLAVLGGAALLAVEARVLRPVLPVELFRDRVFSGGSAAQVLWGIGVNGVFFFTSLFLQDVLGFSPTVAGLAFVPLAVAVAATAPLTPMVVRQVGAHWTVALGLAIVAEGLLLVARVGPGAGFPQLLPGLCLIGSGSALTTPLTSCALDSVPPTRLGTASGVLSASREVSGLFGVVVIGVILHGHQSGELRRGASPDAAFSAGYSLGLTVAAVLVVAGAVLSAVMLRPRPGRHRR